MESATDFSATRFAADQEVVFGQAATLTASPSCPTSEIDRVPKGQSGHMKQAASVIRCGKGFDQMSASST